MSGHVLPWALRIGVVFLALTATRFVLLSVRIYPSKSFAWLAGTTLTATFITTFALQFVDLRHTVARTNLHLARQWKTTDRQHRDIDTAYLAHLERFKGPLRFIAADGTEFDCYGDYVEYQWDGYGISCD